MNTMNNSKHYYKNHFKNSFAICKEKLSVLKVIYG